jgi:DNA polymerase I-like protein with 3'-5' exonuclease and polymerase domains
MVYLITTNRELFSSDTYTIITKEQAFDKIAKCNVIQLDTETTGLDPHTCKILTQQFGTEDDQFVIDNSTIDPTYFKPILESDRLFILQNAKFDLGFFLKLDINIKNVYDTFLVECILTTGLEDRKLGLDAIAMKYCNVVLDKSIRGGIHREGLTTRVIKYCADDVTYLKQIMDKQLEQVQQYNLQNVVNLENQVTRIFAKMEYTGISINKEKWLEVSEITEKGTIEIEGKLDNILKAEPKLAKYIPKYVQGNLFDFEERELDINWGSPLQKLNILKDLRFDTDSTGDRFLQINKDKHPLVKELINYNRYSKLASAFGKEFLKFINKNTGRIHYNVWQILSTGRISVSEPNLNQIPSKGELGKQIRNCFIPQQGYKIVGGDYSGMELRIIAEFSKDPLWVNAFNDGQDLHSVLCSATFDIPITDVKQETPFKKGVTYRDIQKTINFGLAYGMSKFKLADTMQIPVGEADKIIKKFFKVVPKVEQFLNGLGELAKARGYIKSGQPYGRIRWFDGFDNKGNFVRQGEIERAGKNTPIQSTNADIIKSALINVQQFIDDRQLPINILLSVYDEIQTECPEDLSEWWKLELDKLMVESAQKVIKSVPIVVDCKIADYWDK